VESRDVEFIENKFQTNFNSISERINNFKIEIKSTNNAGFNPNYRNKRTQIDHFIELRRSQRARKENNLYPNYISSQSIVFLVEGNKVDVLNKILILLIVEDDFKTYKEACLKMLLFQKKKKKIDSILYNNTWTIIDLPPGSKAIGCKWVFKRNIIMMDQFKFLK
jgi:hypothetical protein